VCDSEWHISAIRLYSAIHVGTRWKLHDRRQIKNTDTLQKLNKTQKKQTTQNTAEQNYPGLVASYDTRRPGGFILQHSGAHTGLKGL